MGFAARIQHPEVQPVTEKHEDRPWYLAVTASAFVHLCLIVAAGAIAVSARTSGRLADFVDADWPGAEPAEGGAAATPVVEFTRPLSDGGGAASNEPLRASGDRLVAAVSGAERQSKIAVQLPTSSFPLTTKWLSESRSVSGLTDLIGPVVYGTDGSRVVEGKGTGTGSGSGSGTGSGSASTFFGIHAAGQRVVYIVDASNSMNRPYDGPGKTRFGQMKLELAKSILRLKEEQRFFVIFFNEHANPMPSTGLENAYPQNQQRYLNWVAAVPAVGMTDPRPALSLAMSLNPDVIYLLTDGTFPRGVQGELGSLRQRAVQINTIAFGDEKAEKSLKPLALHNHGQFAFVP